MQGRQNWRGAFFLKGEREERVKELGVEKKETDEGRGILISMRNKQDQIP